MKRIIPFLLTAILLAACSADYESANPSDDDNIDMDYQVQAEWNLRGCVEYKDMTSEEIADKEAAQNEATEQEINELYTFSGIKRNVAEGRLNAYVNYLRNEKEETPLPNSTCTFTLRRDEGTWIKTLYVGF